MRDWLLERDELPDEPLVAMVPVSVRTEEEQGTFGNRVSTMIVPIPTDVEDPRKRLLRAHELLRGAKDRHQALPADLLTDATSFIPPAVAARAARTTMEILGRTRPPLNLVISNVPGPRDPLYCAGRAAAGELPGVGRDRRRRAEHDRDELPRPHGLRDRRRPRPGRRRLALMDGARGGAGRARDASSAARAAARRAPPGPTSSPSLMSAKRELTASFDQRPCWDSGRGQVVEARA